MDIRSSIMGTIEELQRSAPKGSEAYLGYEQLKATVRNTSDSIRLAHMHKQLKEVLEELMKEGGVESTPMADMSAVDQEMAKSIQYPARNTPRLRRKYGSST